MAEYNRPQGFRFAFAGLNTRSTPDAMGVNKSPYAQNIRTNSDSAVVTRPGYQLIKDGFSLITDIKAYSTLGTDDLPRFLVRNTTNAIQLDTGSFVTGLASPIGYGVKMLPFRPSASPQSWMYIAGLGDYVKASAPDSVNAITVQKVGIAEPENGTPVTQIPAPIVGAAPLAPKTVDFSGPAAVDWVPSGISAATSTSSYGITDTVGVVMPDPVLSTRNSFTFNTSPALTGLVLPGMELTFAGTPIMIQGVLPAIPNCTLVNIESYSGGPGLCEMVLSIDASGSLQRGSLIHISQGGNSEDLFVNWVLTGPNSTCTIETSTVASYTTGATITGVGAMIVDASIAPGQAITSPLAESLLTTTSSNATGTLTQTLSTNPLSGFGPEDYIQATLLLSNITAVSKLTIGFQQTNGPGISFSTTGAELSPTATAGEVFNLHFTPSQMLGFVGMPGNLTSVSITVIISGAVGTTCTLAIVSLCVAGGGSPDIGESGTAYQYRVVPRSALTGAVGNPSATMRYGVSPRRQNVTLTLPSAAYDTQIDTWDIYRSGGSLTSYRYLDSVPVTSSTYVDQTFDAALNGTQAIATNNFEPWPSVDVPFQPVAPTVNVIGTLVTVVFSGTWPATTQSWLPGTLLIVGSGGTYTLRSRPLMETSDTYVFEIEENGGNVTGTGFYVPEPFVARQFNPYIWGPDANGVFYGVGDPLRPGTMSFTLSYAPDSAPDTNNIELCPPSEPLIGGEIMNGLSYPASSKRWWGIYSSLSGAPQPIEIPVGHPLAAPYGSTTNGQMIYYWGPDGIYFHSGGPATSLTDVDLYGLFPHDGIPGVSVNVFGGTVAAPDYSRAATFRIRIVHNYLYADYQDSSGSQHTLVCDLRNGAWSLDVYADPVTVHYSPEQTEGSLTQPVGLSYPISVMGTTNGLLVSQHDQAPDGIVPISCVLSTFEFDGGDLRATPQWGDLYVDGLFPFGGIVQPMSQSSPLSASVAITEGTTRQFVTVPLNSGEQTIKFVGLQLQWSEDPTPGLVYRTTLHLWQPSVLPQPETTSNRVTDWFDLGGASYIRGFRFTANTFGNDKNIIIRNGDNNVGITKTINFARTQEQAYSFVQPFIAHTTRIEPDAKAWILFPGSVIWDKDKWPELIQEYSPWMNLGAPGAKYLRAVIIPMDTNGASVNLQITSENGTSFTANGISTPPAVKTPVPIAITVPFIGHEFQIAPSGPVRIWWEEIQFIYDQWPEYINETSAWLNPGGGIGAKYLLEAVIPMSTEGQQVNLTFLSSDNQSSVTLGPFQTAVGEKTEVPMAFVVPFVCHELRITPSANCRLWFDQIKWNVVPYPELTNAYTPILEYSTPDSVYVQGIKLTCDSNNQPVEFTILYDGGQTGPVIGPFTFNGKQTLVTSLTSPFIAHNFQLVPTGPVRVFLPESKWVFQSTPESAIQWGPTQWTAHGMTGYQFIGRLEVSYSASQPVILVIASYDGTSPNNITLPATGGVTQKILLTPTFNKGQLYQYKAISTATFQIFLNDWVVWLGAWGRDGKMILFRNLGGEFGDKAEI